ncbi:gamma-glutamyltransferase family protein [Geochorda subterranea]|uniref:Gamma-glutamyltransferase family protein n=1 Tax=Geochorda subterranea TaxID=3109564 RepID=A0ABZ1BQB1_9FIRM|nr:gamma-glutamyltransferase family protein [Limnochorda sp. LNt]WRP14994.1 gamma-glutamyltransferase family protein [Limnochorda sp. LNt]
MDTRFPYPSARMPVLARRGMVATSHPLAAQAGLRMLLAGGNAVDAAVAAAAALVVVEPTSCGIGGDAFAIVWDGQRLHGLNASGPAPAALDAELLRRRGLEKMPTEGWEPVTVPGVVAGWVQLLRRFGRMTLADVLEPAIEYADQGHPVPPRTAAAWQASEARLGRREDFRAAFLPGGRAPRAGEIFRQPDQARTLRLIGESWGEAMYRGELAQAIARYAERTGGYLTREDLARYAPEWVEPLAVPYRDIEVWELPPNGQGVAALLALGIARHFDLGATGSGGASREQIRHLDPTHAHVLAEALRLALHEAYQHVADPRRAPVPVERFTDPSVAEALAGRIRLDRAIPDPIPDRRAAGGTVYLCTADADGRMVSFIQSNFYGFGSGVVVPGTGIALHNRGAGFNLIPGHSNELAGGKRPFHTIIPGFITRKGQALAAFGVMGGDMQAQGHVQVVSAMVDFGLNPQAALDAPRLRVMPGGQVALERGFDAGVAAALEQLGHRVVRERPPIEFGGGQIIWRDPDTGVYIAGSDPRKDGQAVGY